MSQDRRSFTPANLGALLMRKIFVLVAAAAALTTAACNTVEGVGRDTQAAGSAVTGAAQDAKN